MRDRLLLLAEETKSPRRHLTAFDTGCKELNRERLRKIRLAWCHDQRRLSGRGHMLCARKDARGSAGINCRGIVVSESNYHPSVGYALAVLGVSLLAAIEHVFAEALSPNMWWIKLLCKKARRVQRCAAPKRV
jgi:hypothetical protein